jgi:hypothetical protein
MTMPVLMPKRVGRPRRCPLEVLMRVVLLRRDGARLQDICDLMNAEGVLTPGGGKYWWPSYVSRLLETLDAQALTDDLAQRTRLGRGP